MNFIILTKCNNYIIPCSQTIFTSRAFLSFPCLCQLWLLLLQLPNIRINSSFIYKIAIDIYKYLQHIFVISILFVLCFFTFCSLRAFISVVMIWRLDFKISWNNLLFYLDFTVSICEKAHSSVLSLFNNHCKLKKKFICFNYLMLFSQSLCLQQNNIPTDGNTANWRLHFLLNKSDR